MPVGIQCFDTAGNIRVDITSRLARVGNNVTITGGVAGSVTCPSGGTPYYAFQPNNIWGFINMDVTRPIFSVSGSVISWSFSPPNGSNNQTIGGTMFYGIY